MNCSHFKLYFHIKERLIYYILPSKSVLQTCKTGRQNLFLCKKKKLYIIVQKKKSIYDLFLKADIFVFIQMNIESVQIRTTSVLEIQKKNKFCIILVLWIELLYGGGFKMCTNLVLQILNIGIGVTASGMVEIKRLFWNCVLQGCEIY